MSGTVSNNRGEWAWLSDIWDSVVVTISDGDVSGSANIAGADVFWSDPTKPASGDDYLQVPNNQPNNNLQMITLLLIGVALVILIMRKK